MKTILMLENIGLLILGITACNYQPINLSWYVWIILFFSPDIGMLGYFINNKWGAVCYNIFHHLGVAIVFYLAGLYYQLPMLQLAGCIIFSHSAFDRVMGYGLKYSTGFKFTHVGIVGSGRKPS
jgi:hypothetical protein